MRLDKFLAEHGLAASRTLAAKLIDAGCVSVNGKIVYKASQPVHRDDDVLVQESPLTEYVSRAGHKLAGALDIFTHITVAGRRCLDAGASTGGFTDVLLRRGASHIAAVDVGHGQLVESLRMDPRVDAYEGLNVRYLTPDIDALAQVTEEDGDLVLMVKPQFEVGKHQIGRAGVVTDPQAHAFAVRKVQDSAQSCGLRVIDTVQSPLPGQDGNVEFFLWCKKQK